jgi:hypothetical protein
VAQLPFLGPTYQGRSVNINASRCINFFPELTGATDDKAQMVLVGTPGTALFTRLSVTTAPVRGLYSFANTLFAVVGNTLYSIASDGTYTSKGTLSSSLGRVSFADNGMSSQGVGGDQLMLCDGTDGYIYSIAGGGSFTKITDTDFLSTPTTVTYLDGYFIVIDRTMRFVVSDLYNGLSYNGLATAAVSSLPDNIQSVIALNNQLFFIKEYSSESWYNAAIPTADGCPFARVNGAVYDYGTPAPWSVARGANSLFFISSARTGARGNSLNIVQVTAYQPVSISTPPIAYKIATSTTLANCFGYCYSDQGHLFYVLTNPDDNWTIVYDAITQLWHERSSLTDKDSISRHLSNDYVVHGGKHYVGDFRGPNILEMNQKYLTDNGFLIHSIRTAQHIYDNNEFNSVFISRLDIDAETGVGKSVPVVTTVYYLANGTYPADGTIVAGGLVSGSTAPVAYLSWSNDAGHTWSDEYSSSLGSEGQFTARLTWRRLGYSKDRVFKLRIESPVVRNIIGAYTRASL